MSNENTPTLQYKTHQGDGGAIVGIRGEDTKESLLAYLIEKYGERLDVEATKKLNSGVYEQQQGNV